MEEMVERKPGFFRRLQASKKKQAIFFVLCMSTILGLFLPTIMCIQNENNIENKVSALDVVIDREVLVDIEFVEERNGYVNLSGWIMKLNSKNENVYVILQATDYSDMVLLKTELEDNQEVEDYYGNGFDFGKVGFSGSVERKLKMDKCYEILAVLEYGDTNETAEISVEKLKKISTGKYLYCGEIFGYDPKNLSMPQTDDVKIQNIIQFGELCAYDAEKQIWVYELNGQLQMIAHFLLFGELKYRPEIPLYVYFISDEGYLEKDYIGYYLSEKDYAENKSDGYYVYSVILPKDKLVTSVNMGIYINATEKSGWLWETNFCPEMVREYKK